MTDLVRQRTMTSGLARDAGGCERRARTIFFEVLSILALVLVLLTAGCGFTIHFGGEQFRNAVTGHMVLGVLALLLASGMVIAAFVAE